MYWSSRWVASWFIYGLCPRCTYLGLVQQGPHGTTQSKSTACHSPSFLFLSLFLLSNTVESSGFVTSWAKEWGMFALVWRSPSLKKFFFKLLFKFLHKGHASLHGKKKNWGLCTYFRVLTLKQGLLFTIDFECQETRLEVWKLVS